MAMQAPPRGTHLVTADRGFAVGAGILTRALAPSARRLLDRIDRGIEAGRIDVVLPGGATRTLGGRAPGPAARVTLRDWRPLLRLVLGGSAGWYRSWAEGEWTSPDPVPLFDLFMRNRHSLGEAGRSRGAGRLVNRLLHRLRRNDRDGARRNIAFHYDLGNDFYAAWLDETLSYSSALFAEPISEAEPLEAAQLRKIDALLDRLALRPGDRLLEIGCGWGALLERAARTRGVHVTGITLSQEQKAFAERRLAGLPAEIALTDYRDLDQRFDAVVSCEMVEAVGQEYWRDYLRAIARALKPGGRAALQYIAIDDAIFDGYAANADFIQTYIFPGGMLLSEGRFERIAREEGLDWRDRRGFALHYAETLRRWRQRFDAAVADGRLPPGFDDRFVALWRYYLMYCEGGFRGGGIDVAQVTLVRR